MNTKKANIIKNNDKILKPDSHQERENISKLMRLTDKAPPSNNCIYCTYSFYHCDEINLMHDYKLDVDEWPTHIKSLYIEAREKNKNFLEENIDIYIDNRKINLI